MIVKLNAGWQTYGMKYSKGWVTFSVPPFAKQLKRFVSYENIKPDGGNVQFGMRNTIFLDSVVEMMIID